MTSTETFKSPEKSQNMETSTPDVGRKRPRPVESDDGMREFFLQALKMNKEEIIQSFQISMGEIANKVEENVKNIATNKATAEMNSARAKEQGDELKRLTDRVRALEERRPRDSGAPRRAVLSEAYLKARRSIRVWPVGGSTEEEIWGNAGEFLHGPLAIPEAEICVLQSRLDDLEGEHGIRVVHKSRDGRLRRTAGGVAVAFRTGACNLRKRELKSIKQGQEILCVTGKVGKVPRKVAVFVVYVPPDMRAQGFRELCDTLVLELAAVKVALGNPIIYVTGDFTLWDVGPAVMLSAGLTQVVTAPTRGMNTLDLIYTNAKDECKEVLVLPPLDTSTGIRTDHRCVHIRSEFPPLRNFTWVAKLRRSRNRAAEEAFAADLEGWDWSKLSEADSVDGMALELEKAIAELTDRHFPMVRVRRRSNEDPWITRHIRRLWKKKIRIYKKFGKSQSWWETDRRLQEEIAQAKEAFVERLLEDGNNGRPFYAATRKLAAASSAQPWRVNDLFVGMGPEEVCREVLDFFGKIARTEDDTGLPELPRVRGGLGVFTVERTTKLLKASKKKDSRVEGDPLPHLVRSFPASFARPVADIFNRIDETGRWPARWKTEHLTIIPKNPNPVDLSECRNISSTSIFSKILEGQVLNQLRGELEPDPTQYGGLPKCGVEHMLLDLWEEVLEGMEGGKSAAVVLGVDYQKAFNCMEHGVCLEQLQCLGASEGSLSLVRAFLEGRTMKITIDGHTAEPVPIQRGSPQGSVLGCLLYCATTQGLTKGLRVNGGDGDRPLAGAAMDRPGVFMYVDDTTLVNIVETNEAVLHVSTAPTVAHLANLELQGDLQRLNERAQDINMKINASKTQLLVISPPNGYRTKATVSAGNEDIQSVDRLKLVGFTFGGEPGVGQHVRAVEDKVKRKIWMLYKLRSAGIKGAPLYRLYCCYLRAIVEYCLVVYHAMLTKEQAWDLERLQRLAVRICFGSDQETDDIMAAHGVESLEERRVRRCDVFLRKAFQHPRFSPRWFPPRRGQERDLRRRRAVEETRALTNRKFNSPLAFLKRRANELGLTRTRTERGEEEQE